MEAHRTESNQRVRENGGNIEVEGSSSTNRQSDKNEVNVKFKFHEYYFLDKYYLNTQLTK